MIDIRHLHFRYRKKPVFTGLSLSLQPGHIYGLLGKNGTGKSTLLRTMTGLLAAQKGSVAVNGFQPFRRHPDFLQQIFMVPEEFYLPDVSVDKYISCNARFYEGFNRQQMDRYLKEFDIPLENSLQQMSYGQKKKVLISFGLSCNTSVLLMDEPTNGLDIISKSQFRKIIASAVADDRCIVISTHQVKDLENLIDRIMIIDEGVILFDQNINTINDKLVCKISYDSQEVKDALFSEDSIHGNSIIARNEAGEDGGRLDLEMLYKAIVTNGDAVRSVFK